MKKVILFIVPLLLCSVIALAQTGMKKRRPLPYEYGRVELDNHSSQVGMAPVVFDHWLHRAKFTCRLCHVDIGFAMEAGKTNIKASDNMQGYYCGTCHNGKLVIDNNKVFTACSERDFFSKNLQACNRCHSKGKEVDRKYDFKTFTQSFPRGRFGNGVDWEKAEEEGKINPIDYLEGVSIKREPLSVQADFELDPKVKEMPDIIFSHKKHTVWNGCELCHPEIFIGIKRGATKYSMMEIFDGKYCGVCHRSVAFPVTDCQRCHTKRVQ
jgi:c(7)-type cytochrome triheme protein